jgi:hypothetical protein
VIPYLLIGFALGFALGLFTIALVSAAGRDDAYRDGIAAGREALQRETLERVWEDLDLDSYGGTDSDDTPAIHTEDSP